MNERYRRYWGVLLILSLAVLGCENSSRSIAEGVDSVDEPEVEKSSADSPSSESLDDVTVAEEHLAAKKDPSDQTDDMSGENASPGGTSSPATDNDTPRRPDESTLQQRASKPVLDITFEDLRLDMEPDTKFERSLLTDRVESLEGRNVRLRGFMYPSFTAKGITQFILLKNTQCPFGPGGTASHCVWVELVEGKDTDYRGNKPVTVSGQLTVNPYNGPGPEGEEVTYAAYRIRAENARY